MKCKRNSDGRSIDHATLQVMRQRAVKAVKEGQSPEVVALAFGINKRSLYRWLADFASGGQNALLAKPISGRPPKVTAEEMQWIAQAVKDNTPQQYRFDFGLWTLALIGELIQYQFNKTLSKASVSRVMKILGFTVQKPLYQAWQQDEVLVQQWQAETYPAIKREAKQTGATIYFGDESGLRSDYHTGTTWAPCGQTPVVNVTGSRFSLNMLSAVGVRGEFSFMVHEGSVNSEVFLSFLKRLMQDATTPVILIVDGHSIHKTKIVKDYVNELAGKLKIYYLPPYSPQLNPDEQVWAHVKREVAKKFVQSKVELEMRINNALNRLKSTPDLVASFFRHPDCEYSVT